MQHHQSDGFFDRVRGFDRNDTSVGGVEHSDDVFGTLVCRGRKGSFYLIAGGLRGCNERDLGVDPHCPKIRLGDKACLMERILYLRTNPDTPPLGTEPRQQFAYTAARLLSAFDLFLDFAKTIGYNLHCRTSNGSVSWPVMDESRCHPLPLIFRTMTSGSDGVNRRCAVEFHSRIEAKGIPPRNGDYLGSVRPAPDVDSLRSYGSW